MAPWILLYPLILIVLAFVAVYEYRSSTTLSLPLSPALTILAILLPFFSFANAFALPVLAGPSHRRTSLVSSLLQALQLLQLILSVVLSTFFFSAAAPSAVRSCLLSTTWQRLFAGKNAAAIRYIQDALDCCGFNSVRDRAWPFAEDLRSGGGVACAERFGRQVACGSLWGGRLQRNAGVDGGVAVTITVLQVVMFFLVRWATARQQSRWPQLLGPFANANSAPTGASRPLLGSAEEHEDLEDTDEVVDADHGQQNGDSGQRGAVEERPSGGVYGTNGPRVEPSFNSDHGDQNAWQ